mmetsp:Transcript_101502/g.295809  ORF Transcript_101502/g.295809 Transcript_101502/m.295809 type:complete len:204 (-) Transcript_101502:69-680(-)
MSKRRISPNCAKSARTASSLHDQGKSPTHTLKLSMNLPGSLQATSAASPAASSSSASCLSPSAKNESSSLSCLSFDSAPFAAPPSLCFFFLPLFSFASSSAGPAAEPPAASSSAAEDLFPRFTVASATSAWASAASLGFFLFFGSCSCSAVGSSCSAVGALVVFFFFSRFLLLTAVTAASSMLSFLLPALLSSGFAAFLLTFF